MTKSYFPYNSKNKTRDKIQYHVYLIPNILFTQTNNKFHQKKEPKLQKQKHTLKNKAYFHLN